MAHVAAEHHPQMPKLNLEVLVGSLDFIGNSSFIPVITTLEYIKIFMKIVIVCFKSHFKGKH